MKNVGAEVHPQLSHPSGWMKKWWMLLILVHCAPGRDGGEKGVGGTMARRRRKTSTSCGIHTQTHKHSGHAELGKTRFDDGWDLGQWGRDDDGPFIDGRHSLMGWVCLFVCLFSAAMFSSSSSPLYLLSDISNNGLLLYWTSLHCHW